MKYILEPISQADVEHIFEDAAVDEYGMPHLNDHFEEAAYRVWAVDRAAHSYLTFGDSIIDMDTKGLYDFFWNGKWYELGVGRVDDLVTVYSDEPACNEERSKFRLDAKAALAAFGRFGEGERSSLYPHFAGEQA